MLGNGQKNTIAELAENAELMVLQEKENIPYIKGMSWCECVTTCRV